MDQKFKYNNNEYDISKMSVAEREKLKNEIANKRVKLMDELEQLLDIK